MLHYRLLFVGKRVADPLLESAALYQQRLKHYAKVEIVLLRDSDPARECADLLSTLLPQEHLIALDPKGKHFSTEDLVATIDDWQRAGPRSIAFVVGGADGLHRDLLGRAKGIWSLSKLTFPHRLAQVILLEQLYRAHTVLRGEKYHRN
jgi:23S rRNA (pseudouridine1915-N3)-methyltransferase